MSNPEKVVQPLIRSLQLKSEIKVIHEYESQGNCKILKRIPVDILKSIEDARDIEWMPVKYNRKILEATAAELGEKGVYNLGLKSFVYSIDSSLIGPFFRSALSLLKIKATSLWKLSPTVWAAVYKNCGKLSITEINSSCVEVILDDLSSEVYESRPYLLALAGSFNAVLVFGLVEGEVSINKVTLVDRKVTFRASWRNPKLYRDKSGDKRNSDHLIL